MRGQGQKRNANLNDAILKGTNTGDAITGDDRELGQFWSGIHGIGQRIDRLIRRLETPAPDQHKRIEPRLNADDPSARRPEMADSTHLLMALEGVAMDANIASLKALTGLQREGRGIDPEDVRAMGDRMASATEGYVALASDVLVLDNPLDDSDNHRDPVWAGSLERRFMTIVEAAEALLPKRLRGAERR